METSSKAIFPIESNLHNKYTLAPLRAAVIILNLIATLPACTRWMKSKSWLYCSSVYDYCWRKEVARALCVIFAMNSFVWQSKTQTSSCHRGAVEVMKREKKIVQKLSTADAGKLHQCDRIRRKTDKTLYSLIPTSRTHKMQTRERTSIKLFFCFYATRRDDKMRDEREGELNFFSIIISLSRGKIIYAFKVVLFVNVVSLSSRSRKGWYRGEREWKMGKNLANARTLLGISIWMRKVLVCS